MAVGTFAFGFVLYRVHKSYSESGSESFITGLIKKWTPPEELFEERNAIRTVLMEKAARDRHLLGSQGPSPTYDLRQPEYVVFFSRHCQSQRGKLVS